MNIRKIAGLAVGGVLLILGLFFAGSIVEWVDGSTIIRVQYLNGSVSWFTSSGPHLQLGGSVTTYSKSGQIQFRADKESGERGETIWTNDQRLKVQFNDSGRGWILGSVNYELPLDTTNLDEMHSFYPSQAALEARLIKPALNKSIFLTGQLMNSYESYKEKRSEMIRYVEDQMQNGVYLTRTVELEVTDEFDPTQKKRVTSVQVLKDAANKEQRAEKGQLDRFGVRAFNFAIEDLDYEDKVDQQIADQQKINMSVQTAMAEAKQAVQQKLTAEAQGQAIAEKVKWEQEARNSQIIAQARGMKERADLDVQTAKAEKEATLLRASADAEGRKLKMQADGALEQKLATWLKAQEYYAIAAKESKVSWVPSVIMGGGGAGGNGNAVDFLSILGAKAAKDLALDIKP